MPKINNKNGNSKFVRFKTFTWAIGLIMGVLILLSGWLFAGMERINGRIDGHDNDIVETKIFTGEVKTDLQWIKETLRDIKENGGISSLK